MRYLRSLGVTVAAISMATACGSTPAAPREKPVSADAWAVVDGREITRDNVEKAYRRTRDARPLSDEETMTAKLALLNDLILQDILLAKATSLKIEVPDSDLDTAYNDAKKNIPDDAFQQELSSRGVTVADMRDGLRRELLSQKVIAQEVGSKIAVSEIGRAHV